MLQLLTKCITRSNTNYPVVTFIDDDGEFGYVTVAPQTAQSSVVFLEVLWPTTVAQWGNLPNVQVLAANSPQNGFSVPVGASKELWIYNTSGNTTSDGGLTIHHHR